MNKDEFLKHYSNVTITEGEVYPCPLHRWKDIKDEVPSHNEFVLCIGTSGIMEVLRCDRGLNNYVFMNQDLSHQVTGITHWMYLPEPPK